jgi:hypothetical protein
MALMSTKGLKGVSHVASVETAPVRQTSARNLPWGNHPSHTNLISPNAIISLYMSYDELIHFLF